MKYNIETKKNDQKVQQEDDSILAKALCAAVLSFAAFHVYYMYLEFKICAKLSNLTLKSVKDNCRIEHYNVVDTVTIPLMHSRC